MSKILEVTNLKKYFPTPKGFLHAVDDISFTMEKGETLGLVGESGSGKSTAGRLILRLLEATDGQVLFENKDVTKANKREVKELRKDIQMIFQDPFSSLNPRFSLEEIIAEPLIIHNIVGKNKLAISKEVSRLMDLVGLSDRLRFAYPHELDGGRRQRIGIARALALQPKFIVADEPVSALDVSIQAQILNLMQDLQDELGLTYLFITHDLSVVRHISDRIAVMYLGQIVELTDYKSIFENPLHPYTQALLSAIPIAKIGVNRDRIILEGDVPSPINPATGCRFAGRCQKAMDICKDTNPQLREIEDDHFVMCHLYNGK